MPIPIEMAHGKRLAALDKFRSLITAWAASALVCAFAGAADRNLPPSVSDPDALTLMAPGIETPNRDPTTVLRTGRAQSQPQPALDLVRSPRPSSNATTTILTSSPSVGSRFQDPESNRTLIVRGIGRKLGKGGFGEVLEVYVSPVDQPEIVKRLAMKVLLREDVTADLARQQEINKLLAPLYSSDYGNALHRQWGDLRLNLNGDAGKPSTILVSEIMDGNLGQLAASLRLERSQGDLQARIQRVSHIATSILGGVKTLAEHGLVHGDLKPTNIFFAAQPGFDPNNPEPDKFAVKLADFDTLEKEGRPIRGLTPSFSSPELLRASGSANARASFPQDLFAFSTSVYQVAFGSTPIADFLLADLADPELHQLRINLVLDHLQSHPKMGQFYEHWKKQRPPYSTLTILDFLREHPRFTKNIATPISQYLAADPKLYGAILTWVGSRFNDLKGNPHLANDPASLNQLDGIRKAVVAGLALDPNIRVKSFESLPALAVKPHSRARLPAGTCVRSGLRILLGN